MFDEIKVQIPVVTRILERAEQDIKRITGVAVSLEIIGLQPISINNPDVVAKVICDHFAIGKKQLCGRDRDINFVLARQCFIYFLCRKFRGRLSMMKVGKLLSRDHTTIVHHVKRIKDMIEVKDQLFMLPMRRIERRLLKIQANYNAKA